MRMQDVEQKRPTALRKLKRKADKFTELDSGKSTKLSAASIRAAALLDHLKVSMKPGCMYSVPKQSVAVMAIARELQLVLQVGQIMPPSCPGEGVGVGG